MRFLILGALQVLGDDGGPLILDRRHASILAVLLVARGRAVGRDYLIDAVWEEAPPATAARQLQNCVSRLRRDLPGTGGRGSRIVAGAAGYAIQVEPGELDLEVFEQHAARAQEHKAAGRPEPAVAALREALALWRGPSLTGLAAQVIEAAGARLNELRSATVEECIDLELALGNHHGLVGELIELVAAHPVRERLVGQLMQALHGSGRRSDALDAYERLRQRLAGQLGLDPGAALQDLHARILRDELAVADAPVPSPSPQVIPRQLPAPVRHFVGRTAALSELDSMLQSVGRGSVATCVISGTGGIGKTALAVRWAHAAAARFPDGQLFVNLRGFDPTGSPIPPAEAIRVMLDALGVAPDRLPADLDSRVSLYRSLLSGRRMLVVLDNARDVEQVRPLLPGGDGCMVVITSRTELTGLVACEGALPVSIDLLTADESRRLLAKHLGADRVDAEPVAVRDLVRRCARLPLALAIIAARAATHPTFPLATFAAELADSHRRLDAVDGGDESTRVRAVISWSYQRLPAHAARLFRLIGVHPGPDVTAPTAANLAGVPLGQARQALVDLARAHLVAEHTTGRYGFHDLLSAYATEQAMARETEPERQAALRRVLIYYLHAAARADVLVAPHRRRTELPPAAPPTDLPVFDGHVGALAWLHAERANLVAAVTQAWEQGEHDLGWRLANLLWGLFNLRKHWADWIATHEIGLACARKVNHRQAQATLLSSLGTAHREIRQFDEAYRYHEQALEVAREIRDRRAEALARNGLGAVCGDRGDRAEALRHFDAALHIRREIADRWGEAITICNIGEELLGGGDVDAALSRFTTALEIRREIGDRWGEAIALSCLGMACQAGSQPERGIEHFLDALAIHRELRDDSMEALTLHRLGMAYALLDQAETSRAHLDAALAIYLRLGMPAAAEVRSQLDRQR